MVWEVFENGTVVYQVFSFTLIIKSIVTNPEALDWLGNSTLVGLYEAFNLSWDYGVYSRQYLL
jgi:hypothetical protein